MHNYNTRNKDKICPAIAKHAYRDKDFRLVGVHVLNYICDNINIATSFASFKTYLSSSSQCGTLGHNVASPPMTVLSNHLSFTHSQTNVRELCCYGSFHVVFGRPLLRFPVGVHLRATFGI